MLIAIYFKTPDAVINALESINMDYEQKQEFWLLEEEITEHIEYGENLTVYYNTETKQLQLKD